MKFLDFSQDEYEGRLQLIQSEMRTADVDGLVLTDPKNVTYLTGYRSELSNSKFRPSSIAIVPLSGQPVLILPNIDVGIGLKGSWVDDVRGWGPRGFHTDGPDHLTHMLTALGEHDLLTSRLGIELDGGQRIGMTIAQFDELKSALPQAQWVNCAPIMWAARSVKSEREISYLKVAAEATDKAFLAAVDACSVGVNERDVQRVLAVAMSEFAEGPGFLGLSSGPDRHDMANHRAVDRTLEKGDMVCFDIGATYRGYWSDFSRQIYIGEPTKRQREFHEAELAAFWAGVNAVEPGVTCEEIDATCERAIRDLGFIDHIWHRTGHAIGLEVHESPSLALGDKTVLKAGMVFDIEPGLYDFSIGAWLQEDMILVTDTGCEVLTNAERGVIVR